LIDQTDLYLKGEGQIAEAQMVSWQSTMDKIKTQLKVVDKQLK